MQPQQMTQEQAVAQIKIRKANLEQVIKFKQAENDAVRLLIASLESRRDDLTQIFPADVVDAFTQGYRAKLMASDFEVKAINDEIQQAVQLLQQAASPILVPSRGGVMPGGGVMKL